MPLLHYLPKPFFDKILVLLKKKWATGEYMNLLCRNDIIRLMEMADIKNYKIIQNNIGPFTLDYVIISIQ